jgi:hypothetical protein
LAAGQLVLLSIQRGKSRPTVNTLLKSRMKRAFQVRFCEEVGVKVPCLTRLAAGVLDQRPCKPLSVLSFRVIIVSAVRCVFYFY